MKEFNNQQAADALSKFRENPGPKTLGVLAQTVLVSPLLCPVIMDKEPEIGEDGNLKIAGDTKMRMASVRTTDKRILFPLFTSVKEARDFYKEQKVLLLPMQFMQYYPMVARTADKTEGIVLNPANGNLPMKHDLLRGMADSFNKEMRMAKMKKGQTVHLKNPESNIDDLEAALISFGFNEEPVQKIYLKERVMDPEHPENTHWFVVIDSQKNDPQIFSRLKDHCRDVLHDKELEMIFTDQKLGQDIAKSSRPVYERMDLSI